MAWLRTDYRLRGKEEPPPLHAQVCAAADAAAARGGERAARGTVRRFFEELAAHLRAKLGSDKSATALPTLTEISGAKVPIVFKNNVSTPIGN